MLGVLMICWVASAGAVIDVPLSSVLESAPANRELRVIVRLRDFGDLKSNRENKFSREELIRGRRANAFASQKRLGAFLREHPIQKVTPLWLINGFAMTANSDAIRKLALHPWVDSVSLNQTLSISPPVYSSEVSPGWNISHINAPSLWSLGFTGSGVVVGVMDTGADIDNPHLQSSYRGGSNSWFDPMGIYPAPHDTHGHGTQVLGVILGSNDIDAPIGVAPAATWIAAKIFNDAGVADTENIHRSFEWMLDPDGNPNTNDAPQIVNCSWGLTEYVDQCQTEFQADISYLRQAGIAVVFAAGNENVNPSLPCSVSPANYPESISVGAVDSSSIIASFSSRGPSACDNAIYPKFVAPGKSIETCDLSFGGLFDQHVYVDGTSFAAPHVTGAMVLLLSAFPELNVVQLEKVLTFSAVDLGTAGPDNSYGYGLIDSAEAYQLAKSLLAGDADLNCEVTISDIAVLAGEWLNCDSVGCMSDMNGDGNVDFADFVSFANNFNKNSCL